MDGLIIIPMDGPAQALLLLADDPDEALGHEARHALQRWRHGVFMTNSGSMRVSHIQTPIGYRIEFRAGDYCSTARRYAC